MRVLLKSDFSPFTGYGNDGQGLAYVLDKWGAEVHLLPKLVAPPLNATVARLLTRPPVAPYDLMISHVDPGSQTLSPAFRRVVDVAVAWTMWEWTTMDNLQPSSVRMALPDNLRPFDAVFVYDGVTEKALQPVVSSPMRILQGGYWPDFWKPADRNWFGDEFNFFMLGELNDRKDPNVAIEAFCELKREKGAEFSGAKLHLKTTVPLDLHIPEDMGVVVHHDRWPVERVRDFYHEMHVLLAPSRGEGKHVPALEFMTTGGVVAITNWGGPTQWLSSAYAYPLRYDLVPVSSSLPDCLSAKVSKEHLKQVIWHCYINRAEVRQKGDLARRTIPHMCSWDSVLDRFFRIVAESVPGKGNSLLHKALLCRREEPQSADRGATSLS